MQLRSLDPLAIGVRHLQIESALFAWSCFSFLNPLHLRNDRLRCIESWMTEPL
jgi:hypothetical protein